MDTQKYSKEIFRFIILIPHRDTQRLLYEYRKKLFSSGLTGAHAFPAAAPLAQVSAPFSTMELKDLGRNLRDLTIKNDGRIQGTTMAAIRCSEHFSFFGPQLKLETDRTVFPQSSRDRIIMQLSPPLLCAALISPGSDPGKENHFDNEGPAFSFRAAALANLSVRFLDEGEKDFSLEWRTGALVWLPAYRRRKEE